MESKKSATSIAKEKRFTRIQIKNRNRIFKAALLEFSQHGQRASTLEQIAGRADMSKQNLLYYFESKEAVFVELIEQLMELWLEPIRRIDKNGDPVEEILSYVSNKLDISQNHPQESRLFANEIIQGSPNISPLIKGPLRTLVDEKAKAIQDWVDQGKIKPIDPYDLIFSIWATTQHYADFAPQISLVTPRTKSERYEKAHIYLNMLFRSVLELEPD